MKITSVKVRKEEKEGSKMKGMASIEFDNCFLVRDIRIIQGKEKLFLAMPSRKTATGGYVDLAYPINKECRKMLEDAVFEVYNNLD